MRRGSSATVHRALRVRTPFECLESRLLLSASPTDSDLSYPYVPQITSSLIVLQPTLGDVSALGSGVPITSALTLPSRSESPAPAVQGWTARVTPFLAMVGQGHLDSGVSISGRITVLNDTTGSIGEDGVSPVIVVTDSGQALSPLSSGGSPLPGHGGTPPSSASMTGGPGMSPEGGAGDWSVAAPTGSSAPPPEAGVPTDQSATGGVTSLPASRRVEVEGSLGQDSSYMTLQIPVGPSTRELGLSVHGEAGGDATMGPVLGEMSLVDRNGDTLARLGPLYDSQASVPTDAVTLSLDDVPAGGTLIVQIAARSMVGPGTPSPPEGSTSATGWTLPFVMDVQRLESSASGVSAATISLAGPGRSMIGTLQAGGSPGGQGLSWSGGGGGVDAEATTAISTAAVDPGEVAQGGDETGAVGSSSAPDLGARIATGPLAARTAATLGPNLSSVMAEPAPAIDRHERALSQEIAAIDAEWRDEPAGAAMWPGDPASNGVEGWDGSGDRPASPGEAVVSIAGLGPLPLKVSSAGMRVRGGGLDALQAALAGSTVRWDHPADAGSEDRLDDPLLAALSTPGGPGADRRPTPDYLTSACILALGMGLVTGPIIPDLLRLIPPRSSRWTAIRGSGANPQVTPVSRERVFGTWFRRRLGC